jgi:hypothetical protein
VETAPVNNELSVGDQFFTNIFIISYNQDAEKFTIDIFGQVLANWKFNNNILKAGVCNQTAAQSCIYGPACQTPECPTCAANEYCVSSHDVSVRDTKRLADLNDLNELLAAYKAQNGGLCPKMESGSYLPNKSVSTWPSWQETLGKALGANLPFDPINRMGACAGYNAQTCWNETTKQFNDPTPLDANFDLPNGSRAYIYLSSPNGQQCSFYVNTESGLTCNSAGLCSVGVNLGTPVPFATASNPGAATNTPPKIVAINMPTSIRYVPYQGFIQAEDGDNDNLTWTLTTIGDWSTWVAPTLQVSPASKYQRKLVSSKSGNLGNYTFEIKVDDGRGGIATATSMVRVGNYCDDKDGDGYGVCPNCGKAKGCFDNGNDCDDDNTPGGHSVVGLNGPFMAIGSSIHPGAPDNCTNYNGLDNDCNGVPGDKAQITAVTGGHDGFEAATAFVLTGVQNFSHLSVDTAENLTSGGGNSILISQDITPLYDALYPKLLMGHCSEDICKSLGHYNGNCTWDSALSKCTTPGDACGKTLFNNGEPSSCWGGAFDQNRTYLNLHDPFGSLISPGNRYIVSFYYKGTITPSAALRVSIGGYPGWESQLGNPVSYPPARTCRGVWANADFIKSTDGAVTGVYNSVDSDDCYKYWHDGITATSSPSTPTTVTAGFVPAQCYCALHAKSLAQQTAAFPASGGLSIGTGTYSNWTYYTSFVDTASALSNVKFDDGSSALEMMLSMGYNSVDQAGTKLYIDDFVIDKCVNLP